MKIAIGNDHAAPELKLACVKHLEEQGFEVTDTGVAPGEKCDYPDAARRVCELIQQGKADLGILICGTGIGMSMAANKFKGIRAACCSEVFSARLTREHNDANVLCFGGRVIGEGTALDLVDVFVRTPYSGEERHEQRIAKITAIETKFLGGRNMSENIELTEAFEDDDIITLTDENGKESPFELIDIVGFEEKQYAVLIPYAETEEEAEESSEVIILELIEGEEEDELVSVTDERVLTEVYELFKDMHEDEFNFVED